MLNWQRLYRSIAVPGSLDREHMWKLSNGILNPGIVALLLFSFASTAWPELPDAPLCGEPLYEARTQSAWRRGEKPQVTEKQLREFFKIMSRNNLAELESVVYPLSPLEKRLTDLLRDKSPALIHRIPADRLDSVLREGALYSPRQAQLSFGGELSVFTPPLEDKLFGGHHCVFATSGPPRGRVRYGDVEITIKSNLNRLVWASPSSGWFFIRKTTGLPPQEVEPTFAHQLQFSHQVILEQDFNRYFQLISVLNLRRKTEQEQIKALEDLAALRSTNDIYEYVDLNQLGYLEVRIFGSVHLEDVEKIEVPAAQIGSLRQEPHFQRWAHKIVVP